MPSPEASEPPIRHVRRIEGTSDWEVIPERTAEEQLEHWQALQARGVDYADQEVNRITQQLRRKDEHPKES